MNKRIVAISILLLMICAMAVSVFAEDTEYEYTVTVQYRTKGGHVGSKTYTLWASSVSDAREQAKKLCEWDFGPNSNISCGIPQVTGKSR